MSVRRFSVIFILALFCGFSTTPVLAQQAEEQEQRQRETPLEFAQRRDVSIEIRMSADQRGETRQLALASAGISNVRFEQLVQSLDANTREEFLLMGAEGQQQIFNEIRQDVELEMLDEEVLQTPQMDRFQQLWAQRQGLDAITSGPISQQLNLSTQQLNQILSIRNDGQQLANACPQYSSNGSNAQRDQIINSIQTIVFDQSINVLENAQIDQLVVNLGEPFTFDPDPQPQTETPDSTGEQGVVADGPTGQQGSSDVAGGDAVASAGASGSQDEGGQSRGRR